jgi:SAM-dependent methyltransferase
MVKNGNRVTEPRGQELISRYRANYGIPEDCIITEEMILEHWELEKRLRTQLLESTPDNRWEVFESCYSGLFRQLDLHTRSTYTGMSDPPSVVYANWLDVIGPPLKVYEVGSGKGELIRYLAGCGYECKGTEITRERGEKWVCRHPNLSWGVSDGVHLDLYEPTDLYDAVISKDVVEHLHPRDLLDHFRGVFSILSNGGRYIFSTPHASAGPGDISRVFRHDTLMGTHLKEYTYSELARLLKQAGFRYTYSVLRLPVTIRRLFGSAMKPRTGSLYMGYLCIVEKLIATLPTQRLRRKMSRASRLILFSPSIMIAAKKVQTPVDRV